MNELQYLVWESKYLGLISLNTALYLCFKNFAAIHTIVLYTNAVQKLIVFILVQYCTVFVMRMLKFS